jgi:hypothetical protein
LLATTFGRAPNKAARRALLLTCPVTHRDGGEPPLAHLGGGLPRLVPLDHQPSAPEAIRSGTRTPLASIEARKSELSSRSPADVAWAGGQQRNGDCRPRGDGRGTGLRVGRYGTGRLVSGRGRAGGRLIVGGVAWGHISESGHRATPLREAG